MKLSENEKIILKKLRAMKPNEELIIQKKAEKDPTEFKVEKRDVEFLKRVPP